MRHGVGGIEALARLREIDPRVRAIASSGYTSTAALVDPGTYGFAAVLPKPYTFDAMLEAVEHALGTRPGAR